jgi:hypothetical protein
MSALSTVANTSTCLNTAMDICYTTAVEKPAKYITAIGPELTNCSCEYLAGQFGAPTTARRVELASTDHSCVASHIPCGESNPGSVPNRWAVRSDCYTSAIPPTAPINTVSLRTGRSGPLLPQPRMTVAE